MKRKIYLILATAIFALIGIFGYFHFNQPQAEEEFTGDFGSENNHYRNTETKNLSPYAIFGDSSFVLMTEAERTGKHTLEITNRGNIGKTHRIILNIKTGLITLFDKKGKVVEEFVLKPETIARFLSVDRLAHKYTDLSPYNYVANNPIRNIDPNGDSIWVTTGFNTQNFGNGMRSITINHTIHIQGKVLDLEGIDVATYVKNLNSTFNSLTSTSYDRTGNVETTVNYSFAVDFSVANSMNDVKTSDHLLVIVDDVLGKSAKGGEAGGLASIGGKIAYVEGASIRTGVHEIGHNMGLIHTFEEKPPYNDPLNFMDYSQGSTSFSASQLSQVVIGAKNGRLNQGTNYQTYNGVNTNNWFWHTSTNEAPYYLNTTKGSKIPKILYNK